MRILPTCRNLTFTVSAVLLLGQLAAAQSPAKYKGMNAADQQAYVTEQARTVAKALSNSDYQFTPEFNALIKKAVDFYSQRIDNGAGDRLGTGDARFVFERGPAFAPALIRAFKARNLSPLFGLYIPVVESEYVNIGTPNMMGSLGLFQFIPQTGQRFGLSPQELLDVDKSADAAARYITANIGRFQGDPMKEALALLSYNRGEGMVQRDIAKVLNDTNRSCSICALTAASPLLDKNFQSESVYYVPRFFAAAIIGENPSDFGLNLQPLSTYEVKR